MAMRLLDIEGSRHAKTIFPTAWRLCQHRSIAPGDLGHWTALSLCQIVDRRPCLGAGARWIGGPGIVLKLAGEKRFENFTAGGSMVKRVPREAALLMLHWQNSVCDPKGVWGKNLCRQIEKNNAIRNAQSVLATARNRGMLTIFVNIGWRSGFPEPAGGPILSPAARRQG
jgi:hypothetical protein